MYEGPEPDINDADLIVRGCFYYVLMFLWCCFILYVGVFGNLVTNVLGLPNNPYSIKLVASASVAAIGTGILWFLKQRGK